MQTAGGDLGRLHGKVPSCSVEARREGGRVAALIELGDDRELLGQPLVVID